MANYRLFAVAFCITIFCALPSQAVEVTLLGPETYARTAGPPNDYTAGFPGVVGQGTLYLTNGSGDKKTRVSSARVLINGVEVISSDDLNKNVEALAIPVDLLDNNVVEIRIAGNPGGYITIQVDEGITADAAGVIGPGGGFLRADDPSSPVYGVSILFPAGAVAEAVVARIEHDPNSELPLDELTEEGFTRLSFWLKPDSLQFQDTVTLRIPIPDADGNGLVDGTDFPIDTGSLFFHSQGELEVFREDAVFDTLTTEMVAEIDHFSLWLLAFLRLIRGSTVGYWIESVPDNIHFDASSFEGEVRQAFAQWGNATCGQVHFEEVNNPALAKVYVRARDFCSFWFAGSYYCMSDGLASRPWQPGGTPLLPWTLSFNTNTDGLFPRLWVTGGYGSFPPQLGSYYYTPFLRVALHEFGHVMGLPDYTDEKTRQPCNGATNPSNIMWYECFGVNTRPIAQLSSIDIDKVRDEYEIESCGFEDDFNDGDFTDDPTWTVRPPDDVPRHVDVIGEELRFLANVPYGNGGVSGIFIDVDLEVTGDTEVRFDGKPVYRNVGAGCGWSCGEFPVNVQLTVERNGGAVVVLRYSMNYGSAVQDKTTSTFIQRAFSVPQNAWTHKELRVMDEVPDAARISKIELFGAGWSYEGWLDNLVISSQP